MSNLRDIFTSIYCLQKHQIHLVKELLNYQAIIEDIVEHDALHRDMHITYKLSTNKQMRLLSRLSYLTRNFKIIEKLNSNWDALDSFDRRLLYMIILDMTENHFKFLKQTNCGALNEKLVRTLFRHGRINKSVPKKIKLIFIEVLGALSIGFYEKAKNLLNENLTSEQLKFFFDTPNIKFKVNHLPNDINNFKDLNNVERVLTTLENENFQILI